MILQILQRTPAWVYVLFVALLALGIWQTRTRAISARRVLVAPLALGAFSLYGVLSGLGDSAAVLAQWAAALLAATAIFAAMGLGRDARYAPGSGAFVVPGSWMPLAAILVVFFLRYAINVGLAIDASLHESALFIAAAAAAYGASSGFFAARALGILGRARVPLAA
ncbi:MAG: DUF6622 family protein [Clostridia bacterium]